MRLRLLVRVEGLCEMACRFLAFHARVASMELLTRKLSEQVLKAQVRTKRQLFKLLKRGG